MGRTSNAPKIISRTTKPVRRKNRTAAASGAFRVICVAKFAEAVYVLHAFQKKAQKTPKQDIELARRRFRELVQERKLR
jgi:phage-related protein